LVSIGGRPDQGPIRREAKTAARRVPGLKLFSQAPKGHGSSGAGKAANLAQQPAKRSGRGGKNFTTFV
jgi:hypothetical protein